MLVIGITFIRNGNKVIPKHVVVNPKKQSIYNTKDTQKIGPKRISTHPPASKSSIKSINKSAASDEILGASALPGPPLLRFSSSRDALIASRRYASSYIHYVLNICHLVRVCINNE